MTLAGAARTPSCGFLNVSAHDIVFRTRRGDEERTESGIVRSVHLIPDAGASRLVCPMRPTQDLPGDSQC